MDIHSFLTLTEPDLVEVGVADPQDRRRLLVLISRLRDQSPVSKPIIIIMTIPLYYMCNIMTICQLYIMTIYHCYNIFLMYLIEITKVTSSTKTR